MSQQVRVLSSIGSSYPTTRETQGLSSPLELHLGFGPYQTVSEKPEGLAAIIGWQSWRRFHEIPFCEWLQYTLGHATDLVEDFLFYHVRYLPTVISSYLGLYPAQLQRYQLATDVLRKQNPFAYHAVHRGLEAHSLRLGQQGLAASWRFLNSSTTYSDWYHTLEFTPLQIVVQNRNPPVKEEWLAERYSLAYTDQTQIDTTLFTLFMERSPHEVADGITYSDVTNFCKLGIQSIIDMDETFRGIGHQWNKLCLHIQEFTRYDKYLAKKALEVAKISTKPAPELECSAFAEVAIMQFLLQVLLKNDTMIATQMFMEFSLVPCQFRTLLDAIGLTTTPKLALKMLGTTSLWTIHFSMSQ